MISLGLDDYRPAREPEKRTLALSDFPGLATYLETSSVAGVVVNENTANSLTAYWNAIDVISSQVAAMPLPVYRRLPDDEREKAATHPAYKVLEIEPNPLMTPFVFKQTLVSHALGWGGGYAEIEWDRANRPIGLWPILPDRIQPYIENNRLYYRYSNRDKPILPEDIIHIPGMGYDGLRGYSVAQVFRRSLGLSIAAEEFGSSFLRNGASASLAVQHPGTLSEGAQKRIRESIQTQHGGVRKAGGILITEEGMKIEQIGIPQKDAQFLEGREFQVVEIARMFNLPPHKLKHKYGERPGGNLEAAQIEFLTDTLRPWLVRIEQECNRKLFPISQRGNFYAEHIVDDILRMDSAGRAASYKVYYDLGVLTAEQIAKKENLPKPEPKPVPAPALPPAEVPDQLMSGRIQAAQRALVVEAMGQFLRMEANAARGASRRGVDAFVVWAEEFYERKADVLAGSLAPIVEFEMARNGQTGDAQIVARTLAVGHAERSRDELLELRKDDLEGQVERLIEKWKRVRPGEMADRIAVIGRENSNAA